MDHAPVDPVRATAAARQLFLSFGMEAFMEAQDRILRANADGDESEKAFWQEVSRLLQEPGFQTTGFLR